jgi:glycerol uptake facilitator-like aquaporin
MIAVVTLLIAFPAGYLLSSRLAANTTYAIAYLWAFVFQTLYLTLDSLSGTSTNPAFTTRELPWSYGVVTLLILAVGFGLVSAGHWLRSRRRPAMRDASLARGTIGR